MTISKTHDPNIVTVVRTEELFREHVEVRVKVHSSGLDSCDHLGFIAPNFAYSAINQHNVPNFALQLKSGTLTSRGEGIPGKVLELPRSDRKFDAEIVLSCDLQQKLCRVTCGEETVECAWPDCPPEVYFASSLRSVGGFVTILEAGGGGGLTKGAR